MTQDYPTVISKYADKVARLAQQAGAKSEDSYERDGAFSYHAESHAFGVGLGVGVAASATGDYRYVAAVVALAFGLNRGPQLSSRKIAEDIKQEPHYLLFGLAIGLMVGGSLTI